MVSSPVTAAGRPCSCCCGGQDVSHSSSNTVDTTLSGNVMQFMLIILKPKRSLHFRTYWSKEQHRVRVLTPCWCSYSYYNNRHIFEQGDMTCLTSSKRTLKPSKTKYPLGKHPSNLMPYKIIPRYGSGARMCCCTSLHDTRTNSLPTHVLRYCTYCCTHLLLCTYSANGGRGEAWGGKNRHTGPTLARVGVPLIIIIFFGGPPDYTLPRLRHSSAYFLRYCGGILLLSYTHHGFVGC